jgi:BMFP domain-containing protein YqiC
MKPNSRFFDDLAKVATGAVGALSGLQGQIRTEIRSQINRFIAEMDFVPREDFEIVEGMAREARLQNQKLEARIATLETKLGIAKKAPAKKTATKKPTKKKAKQ